jgi:hypothetical protein
MTYELGPYFCDNPHHALLHHVLGSRSSTPGVCEEPIMRDGLALEFGVGDGASLRCIARYNMMVVGYDSFQGLPEDWRPGFEEGAFACEPPTDLPKNVQLVTGLFEDTLPQFDIEDLGAPVNLLHIDCDLYSSTKTVLDRCRNLFYNPGIPRGREA